MTEVTKCQCDPECKRVPVKGRAYAWGHKPKNGVVVPRFQKTLVTRTPKVEHTDDSRPTLPIREVSREEFDRMAKASDSMYKPEPKIPSAIDQRLQVRTKMLSASLSKPLKIGDTVRINTFPQEDDYDPSPLDGFGNDSVGTEEPTPSKSGLFLIATSLAAFLAGLIIGNKRSR